MITLNFHKEDEQRATELAASEDLQEAMIGRALLKFMPPICEYISNEVTLAKQKQCNYAEFCVAMEASIANIIINLFNSHAAAVCCDKCRIKALNRIMMHVTLAMDSELGRGVIENMMQECANHDPDFPQATHATPDTPQ